MAELKFVVVNKKLQKLFKSLQSTSRDLKTESNLKLYYLEPSNTNKKIKNSFRKTLFYARESLCDPNYRVELTWDKQCRIPFEKNTSETSFLKEKIKFQKKMFKNLWKFENIFDGSKYEKCLKSKISLLEILPQLIKDKKKLKTTWTKLNPDNTPKFSRGYRGDVENIGGNMRKSNINQTENLDKKYKVIQSEDLNLNKMWKALRDEHDKNLNSPINKSLISKKHRQFFTVENVKLTPFKYIVETPHKVFHSNNTFKTPQVPPIDLPPPQKCRLSCPLPPSDYSISTPPKERLQESRAISKKFSFPHREFSSLIETNREESNKRKVGSRFYKSQVKVKNADQIGKTTPPNSKPKKAQLFLPQPDTGPKMKALLFIPNNLSLNYYAANAPNKIYKDEIIVQVHYSGVSSIDLSITEGKVSCGEDPLILGHEISGKVYAAGSSVSQVKAGDNVVVNPYNACCACRYCQNGALTCCLNEGLNNAIGTYKNGGWAEFVTVKKTQIHKIPSALSLDQAALIHPLSCVLSAMRKLNIVPGVNVFIHGLGLAGCLWASVLHARGHRDVLVSDKNPQKKEQFRALNLGYEFVNNEEIQHYNADVVIECTGSSESIEKCLKIINPNGQMCFFEKPTPHTEIRCIPYDIVQKEITLLGSIGNAFCFTEAINFASKMGHRYLDFNKLGVKIFDLEDYQNAFSIEKTGEVNKIIFKLSD